MSRKNFKKWLPIILAPVILPFIILNFVAVNNEPVETEASYAPYQIPNGGFEAGAAKLDGWKAFGLWKGESGLQAFDSSLVHNGTYFSGYPYNRDGDYQLGITSGSITWDQATERMGYLRSTDFVLGGSGWISFKLGGGRFDEFAHVSIRKTSDDTEVARFGNKNRNDTAWATTVYGSQITNAEAFLFPYYFDLSTVTTIGTSLYILLCDTAAYDWSILSADSFDTYYETAPSPTPTGKYLADNIMPTILGIDDAANSIPNGFFNSDYSSWQISRAGWGYTSNSMRSNASGGDSAVGILRSSAFTVSTNKYIEFDWAGGLKFDKQIFISVKEVGTNIEKIRFVRRDNRSGEKSENWQNHMLNLTSLDASKKYYLEFADARSDNRDNEGYAISYVDSIEIVTEARWNEVTSGDRAVSISGIPTSFAFDVSQEAVTFAQYFIEQTGPICTAMSGDFSSVWGTMGTEYATLSVTGKDAFVDNTTNSTIVAARERYLFIITKYTSLTKFVVDGDSNVYQGSPDIIGFNIGDNSRIILIVVATVMVVSAGLLFLVSRRRRSIA
ncbi:MAG: hypothetical protein WC344_00115 [Bacilli bacterium]|jgi:hypothetical protein